MIGGHISEELLQAFTDGDIGTELGVQIALHLDDCPRCHARARTLDPLTAHFASCDDAPVPEDLFQAISATQQQDPKDVVLPAIVLLALGAVLAFVVNGDATITHLVVVLYASLQALFVWFAGANQVSLLAFSLCFFACAVAISHIRQSRTMSTW